MDLQKFIETQELSTFPIGLGGCRNMNNFFYIHILNDLKFCIKQSTDKNLQIHAKSKHFL